MKDLKQKVQEVVIKKQLSAIMNNTKWELLRKSVQESLQFPPSYQVKYVLEDTPYPEHFEDDIWYLGDWEQGIRPFYSVEWIRVRPRYLKHRGMLINPEVIDITEEFVSMLQRLRIPFVKEESTICIYGYVNHTDILN
jgi:hypothetical protein